MHCTLIVSGKQSQQKHIKRIRKHLKTHVEHYTVDGLPSVDLLKKDTPFANIIIAIGGGSVIDTAKVIMSKAPYMRCIAIPTTAGTGSEVTHFATLWDFKNKEKTSVETGYCDLAIIDTKLTISMPKELTLSTHLDAYCHALESQLSKNSNIITETLANKALDLIIGFMEDSLEGDFEAREQMCIASLLAGLAIDHAKTNLCHALSYPLTLYYNIPHGMACGMAMNAIYPEDNIARWVKIPMHVDVDLIVNEAFKSDRIKNYPKPISKVKLKNKLRKVFK